MHKIIFNSLRSSLMRDLCITTGLVIAMGPPQAYRITISSDCEELIELIRPHFFVKGV